MLEIARVSRGVADGEQSLTGVVLEGGVEGSGCPHSPSWFASVFSFALALSFPRKKLLVPLYRQIFCWDGTSFPLRQLIPPNNRTAIILDEN